MEGGMLRKNVMVNLWVVAALVMMENYSEANVGSFKDCYIKCYVFCIIEPSQTLCSCTTRCFKDCILPPSLTNATATRTSTTTTGHSGDTITPGVPKADRQNQAFCKLGCASSICSNISTNKTPVNGANVENCVGFCSKKCSSTYASP